MRAEKRFAFIATGGTIAGLSDGLGGYHSGQVDANQLIGSSHAEDWQVFEPYRIGSQHAQLHHFDKLGDTLENVLNAGAYDGLLIAHGTDTLEELVVYLLARFGTLPIPVVLVASMRPSDHLQADGPTNLADAKRLLLDLTDNSSTDKQTVAWLPLLVMDGYVTVGTDIAKHSATRVDAFTCSKSFALPNGTSTSEAVGYENSLISKLLSRFLDIKQRWADYTSAIFVNGKLAPFLPANRRFSEIRESTSSNVAVVYTGVGMDITLPFQVELPSVANTTVTTCSGKTVVVACPGNASLPDYLEAPLMRFITDGGRVVVASRLGCEGIGLGNEKNALSRQVVYAPVGWSLPQIIFCERLLSLKGLALRSQS